MTLDECLQLATAAVANKQGKTSFVNAMVAKAEKYRTNPSYTTIKSQYGDMAGKAYDTAQAQAQ